MKKILFTLCLLLPLSLFAQNDSLVYGLNFSNGMLRFAKANVVTGQVDIINNTPTSPDQFANGVSDLDPFGNRYFYVRGGKIYTVDLSTGLVLHSPTITCATAQISGAVPIVNIAYDWRDSTIYGLHYLNSQLSFAKVDPVTGVLTILSNGPISGDLFQSGVSDIDPLLRRYFYIRAGELITVNLDSGTVSSRVNLTNPNNATSSITNIAYNYIDGWIYGINYIGVQFSPYAPAELRLARVNPALGVVEILSQNVLTEDLFYHGVADINPAAAVYSYPRADEMVSVNLYTGQIEHRTTLQNPNNATSPITNIAYKKDVQFEPLPTTAFDLDISGMNVELTDQSIFAGTFHWDFGDGHTHHARHPDHSYSSPGIYQISLVTENNFGRDTLTRFVTVGNSTGIERDANFSLEIFPNPARDKINLKVGGQSEGFQYFWRNGLGQTVSEGKTGAFSTQTSIPVPVQLSGYGFLIMENEEGRWIRKILVD